MARLLLLRHGQSTWNAVGRWQGWADPPLSEGGRDQARAAAGWLATSGTDFARVVASDLVRARETAGVLAGALGLGVVTIDAGLRERDIGDWSGLTRVEIEDRWPGLIDAWREQRIDSTPGGEPAARFAERVRAGLDRAAAGLGADDPVLVVTHGGVVRALERVSGIGPCVIANLSGRWFEVGDGGLRAGPAASMADPDLDEEAVAATP